MQDSAGTQASVAVGLQGACFEPPRFLQFVLPFVLLELDGASVFSLSYLSLGSTLKQPLKVRQACMAATDLCIFLYWKVLASFNSSRILECPAV